MINSNNARIFAKCQTGYRKKDHFPYLSFSLQTQLNSNTTDNEVSSMLSLFLECWACVILKLFKLNFSLIRINTEVSILTTLALFLSNFVNIL